MSTEGAGAYLDASAAIKLLRVEAESDALRAFLVSRQRRISSELLRVELACACRRRGIPTSRADALLAGIDLLPLTSAVMRRAGERFDPPQRALDALHLATAEQAHGQLERFVSYDVDQRAAAEALGWRTAAPAGAP